jgi:CheY-like chemotaxis protein
LGVFMACLFMLDRSPEDGLSQLPTMTAAVDRARKLTEQLLMLSRTGTEQRFCCLDEELRTLTALVLRTIGENITFDATLDAGASTVPLDSGQVGQIVLNLVVNARDAIEGPGRVSMRTQVQADRVRWVAEDDGSGMPPDVAARALEPFFSTKAPGKGSGLGLATVADFVREAGGTLSIDSAPGRGTRVVIDLPIVHRPPQRALLSRSPSPLDTGGGTLILLEDHDALRQSLAFALSTQGYRVLSTGTVREAVYMAKSEPGVVALVTDLHLPDGLGTDCAGQLRAALPSLPVVYMSGMPEAAPKLGTSDTFLPKPVAPADLLRALSVLLSRG